MDIEEYYSRFIQFVAFTIRETLTDVVELYVIHSVHGKNDTQQLFTHTHTQPLH